MKIAIEGMDGVGKTTVTKQLAERNNFRYVGNAIHKLFGIEIGKAMQALMSNRTSFVIAHRLSTIVDADMIFVMQNGTIIEQGNHKQLLEKNGAYADLYNSQFA